MMRRLLAATLCLLVKTAIAADTHVLVISGIGGEEAYNRLFRTWSLELLEAAELELGVTPERTAYLAAGPTWQAPGVDGESRKESILDALDDIASRAAEDDLVTVFLIGHGSMQNGISYFNIPGPDISAAELAEALAPLQNQKVLVVNTAPSSGPFLPLLSGPNRIVITATQNGAENNHTVFAKHLAAALSTDTADTDKDSRVSVLEAFDYARREVEREYRSDRKLLTEHAMLDDDGDGSGSMTPGPDAGDGALAKVTYLGARAIPGSADESVRRELTRLRSRSDELEQQIELLRGEKDRLQATEYEDRLEALLVELALNRRALQATEAGQ